MEFTIKQTTLNRALASVSRITGGVHSTLPILSNVLLDIKDKQLQLTTTNLDMAIQVKAPVKDGKDGKITVPARLLAEFISNLPSDTEINFSVDNNKVKIKAGAYESVINGVSAEDFPEMPDIDEDKVIKFSIPAADFKSGVSQVIVACSSDYTRPALTGVFFNTYENKLYIAATDGYRLAELELATDAASDLEVIVPSSSLREVLNAMDDSEPVEILFDESQVRFRSGDTEITSKLIDGSFPNYRVLIPEEVELKVELDKGEMQRITKIAALFARQSSGTVICEVNSQEKCFSVSAVANEMGENDSKIKIEATQDAKVNLNSRYLMDALNAISEKNLIFGFSKVNSLEPILITNEKSRQYRHIIMPMSGEAA